MQSVEDIFSHFKDLRIGVIGDVMLDTYMWGHVERISPEAPVPIVSLDKKEQRIGGAGNVALNIQSLGATAFVLSVTGEDEDAACLNKLFQNQSIDAHYAIQSSDRITTNKTRIISRNQQMMRLDAEITTDLTWKEEERLLAAFQQFINIEKPHLVILEDYNKGVLTERVIGSVIRICKEANVLTAVDPKRKNFFEYKGVDIFKPNLKEVREALNLLFTDVDMALLSDIHGQLHSHLGHQVSFITLSEKGVFYQQDNRANILPSHIRNVADVSGAGDTVIAVAALVYTATKDIHLMAEMANIAGGLVCEVVGTAAIDRQKLLHESEVLLGF
jgi:rfaE bifunctional protein kinase chain/domain